MYVTFGSYFLRIWATLVRRVPIRSRKQNRYKKVVGKEGGYFLRLLDLDLVCLAGAGG
uniref:Uncharacterized protein n=1 Tax=Los Azufres archaeal virus 2 TaxID=1425359 RepID=A0A0A0P542_9VIRU|nr:hypothetical protein [Los Azufres archaeal virus 2]